MKLVSLCLPTNGISEWVFPVLDSIYSQGVSNDLFEVIVTDNGKNQEFKYRMREYPSMTICSIKRQNLFYSIIS